MNKDKLEVHILYKEGITVELAVITYSRELFNLGLIRHSQEEEIKT